VSTRTIEESDRLSVFYCVESHGAVLALRDKSGNAFATAHIEGEGLDELIEILTRIQETPESIIPDPIPGTPRGSRGAI
jgi:hypothetical protein